MSKSYLTEAESIERFRYYTLELDRLLAMEDEIVNVAESLPFMAHLNKKETLEIEYINKVSKHLVGYTAEEIEKDSLRIFKQLFHPLSLAYSQSEIQRTCNTIDNDEIFTYVEYIRGLGDEDYKGYVAFLTPCAFNQDSVLAMHIQPDLFGPAAKELKKIIEIDYFRLNNFKRYQLLTLREKEILTLIAKGFTNREISELFKLSLETVKTHRKNLVKKLDADNISDLVKIAISFDLVVI